jgi:hypothetical protein
MLTNLAIFGGTAAGGAVLWHFASSLWTAIKTRASADVAQLQADGADLKKRVADLEAALKSPPKAA